VWRQALPVDPSLGEYPEASEVRPALFTRFVPVAGRGGQLPPIQTTSVSETLLTRLGRAGQALKRLVFGRPLDATAIAVERMRKLVALPVLSADALSSVAYRPQGCWASWSWPACPACRTRWPSARLWRPDAGGRDLLPPDDPGLPARRRLLHRRERGTRPRPRRGRPLANYLWTLYEHVAETLQPVLQSLPRVVVTSVPFHLAD
jgi:hypothetical protein